MVDAAGDFAYVTFTGATAAQDKVFFTDSPETAATKRAYWEAQGIMGLFLWQLAGDDPTWTITEAMGPPAGAGPSAIQWRPSRRSRRSRQACRSWARLGPS